MISGYHKDFDMGEIKLVQKFQQILVTDFLAILGEVTGYQQHIRFFGKNLLHTLPEYRITEFDQLGDPGREPECCTRGCIIF